MRKNVIQQKIEVSYHRYMYLQKQDLTIHVQKSGNRDTIYQRAFHYKLSRSKRKRKIIALSALKNYGHSMSVDGLTINCTKDFKEVTRNGYDFADSFGTKEFLLKRRVRHE